MALLIFAFLVILALTFGIVVFVMRPTPEQRAVQMRINTIKAAPGELSAGVGDIGQYLKRKEEGSFGWLEEMFETSAIAHKFKMLILQADSHTSMGTVMMTMFGLGFATLCLTYLLTGMLAVAVIGALVLSYAPVGVLRFLRGRRIAAFNTALPESIDMMSRSLRAGHSLNAAISIVADQALEPAKYEFAEIFKKQNYGLPLRDALSQLLDRVPSQDLRVLVTGIMVQKDTGGNLTEILDRTVFVIRERLRIQGEIRTHTAQGRMTGWILCMLPVIMLFLINVINPGYSSVLMNDPLGRKLLYVGVVLLCVGGLLIRKIVNGIEV